MSDEKKLGLDRYRVAPKGFKSVLESFQSDELKVSPDSVKEENPRVDVSPDLSEVISKEVATERDLDTNESDSVETLDSKFEAESLPKQVSLEVLDLEVPLVTERGDEKVKVKRFRPEIREEAIDCLKFLFEDSKVETNSLPKQIEALIYFLSGYEVSDPVVYELVNELKGRFSDIYFKNRFGNSVIESGKRYRELNDNVMMLSYLVASQIGYEKGVSVLRNQLGSLDQYTKILDDARSFIESEKLKLGRNIYKTKTGNSKVGDVT